MRGRPKKTRGEGIQKTLGERGLTEDLGNKTEWKQNLEVSVNVHKLIYIQ